MSYVPFANTNNVRALDLYNFFGGIGSFPIDQYYRGHIHNSLQRACIPNITENNTTGNVMPAGGQIAYGNFPGKFAYGGSQSFTLNAQLDSNQLYRGFNDSTYGDQFIGSFGSITPDFYVTSLGSVTITALYMHLSQRAIVLYLRNASMGFTWKQSAWRINAPGVNGGFDDFISFTNLGNVLHCNTKTYTSAWGNGNQSIQISWLK